MVTIFHDSTENFSLNHKCGFVAIIGLPNAGKSTLMNRYLKEKVSIVTPKPQTTRNNVTSILSSENFQIIFIDTPGILKPRYKMQEVMASFVRNAIGEADVILLIIDAAEYRESHHPAIISFADKLKAKQVVVAQWVRMKCMFGCGEYGHNACCPPNIPSVSECASFFREYTDAAIFHFEKKVDKPEDRHAWSSKVNLKLSKLERQVFISGHERVFLLFMDSCHLCTECTEKREACKNPKTSRPSPEGMAVDVYSTVRQFGFPIEPLSDYAQAMNRYAFLLIA